VTTQFVLLLGGREVSQGVAGVRRRSWTGHEILLYLIMYRKYGDF